MKQQHEFAPGICSVNVCDVCGEIHQAEQPVTRRHAFALFNSKTDTLCFRCGKTEQAGDHYTKEDYEKILERRRAIMPGYDEALKEWLS